MVFKVNAARPVRRARRKRLFSSPVTDRSGITRFLAGVGSTIVVPVIKIAPMPSNRCNSSRNHAGKQCAAVQPVSRLDITTNDFIHVNLPSTNPNASSYISSANTAWPSFVEDLRIEFAESGIVAMLAVPVPPEAAPGQTY